MSEQRYVAKLPITKRIRSSMSDRKRRREIQGGPQLYRGCLNKMRFTSKRAAAGKLRVLENDPMFVMRPNSTLREYKCRVCKGWHLGNSKERQARTVQKPEWE